MNSRRGYPYASAGPLYNVGREKEKKPRPARRRLAIFISVLLLALGAACAFFIAKGPIFPTKLIALRFMHNGQEMLLLPDSQVIVNPRDSLRIVDVETDGWLSWGIRVVSSDVDVTPITRKPGATIRDLFSRESFENPKPVVLTVLLWNRQIGKVSLLVQLDYKDWLHKANTTPDIDKRITYLQRALQGNSSNVLIKTQLAGLYFDIKHYKEAARLYSEINQSGKSKDISDKLLLVYQAMNKPDQALQVYLDLMQMTEDQQTFGDFLAYLKKTKPAAQAQRFLEKHEREIPNSFRSQVLVEIAQLAGARKDWQGAASAWRNAEKAGITNSDVQYNLAVTLLRAGKTDAAIAAFEQYLRKNPNDAKTLAMLAGLCEKSGHLARAKAIYQSMSQKNPHNKQALISLVPLMGKTNDKTGEIAAYEKLLQMEPGNRKYLFNVSMLYIDQKKYDKALAHLQALASMDPRDVESRKQLLLIYQKVKDTANEVRIRRELAGLDPRDSANLDTLYRFYAQKKDYKGMQAFFRGIAARNPDSTGVHKYLLEADTKMGDKKSALNELNQLIRLQPKQKEYYRLAAYLYEQAGNYAAASKQLQALLKLDFKDKKAQDDYERVKLEQLRKGSLQNKRKPASVRGNLAGR